MIDWEDIHYFIAFARHKSLSGAARSLSVDHATVARRIAALESSLGVKLIARRSRVYVLTADGERIAALGSRMDSEASAIARAARGPNRPLSGDVSISAPPVMSTWLIAPRLGKLTHSHPLLRVHLIGEVREASLHREADVAVRLFRPSDAELVCRKIGTVRFALYASSEYLAHRAPEDFGFIAYDLSLEQSGQQTWLKANAGSRPVVFRSNNLETQWAAARAGVGIAALPHFLGDASSELERVAAKHKPLVREVWLCVHRDLRSSPPVRAVMDFLVSCYAPAASVASSG